MDERSERETHDSPSTATGYGPAGHATPGGLSIAANGLRFVPSETRFEQGERTDWTFRIVDDDGDTVTGFEEAHGEPAHLILVRRDLTAFDHRHPTLEDDGTWRTAGLTFDDPGVYRAFVDVVVDGRPTTLGHDVFVPGEMTIEPSPETSHRTTAGGYAVELLAGGIAAGERTRLAFEIRDGDGRATRLEPYLGALGHLVALREGDLAYLHVHPEGTDPESGRVAFGTRFPTPGRYRSFLQAKPDGELITARFDIVL
ncbi:hypothetical protein [Halalkalicoccus sp. NIPERK01]|uniref:hypothetical protein n=1 Tax=Halalkalicoccus sp. NIPERK01 TaxID=3053469 RepID=UPI00256EFDB8|nr:hypothetical protein [Halalkalicoccus sp. NIPERK01]MDL5360458.1 hypothetical protein [Halalkalicoccus sp. NIPERK01]